MVDDDVIYEDFTFQVLEREFVSFMAGFRVLDVGFQMIFLSKEVIFRFQGGDFQVPRR